MDAYIGETFESKDWRDSNKRLRIESFDDTKRRYKAITISNEGNPHLVGRVTYISGRTLDTRYKKVSH